MKKFAVMHGKFRAPENACVFGKKEAPPIGRSFSQQGKQAKGASDDAVGVWKV